MEDVMKRATQAATAICLVLAVAGRMAAAEPMTILLTTPRNEVFYANLSAAPLKLGYFKQEHLDVKFVFVPGGSVGAQVVGGGKADMYFGPMDPVFKANLIGGNLKAVYVVNHGQQYFPVVAPDSPIKDLRDFKGKKIGVLNLAFGGLPSYKALFKEVGLDPDRDISFIAVGQGAQALAALKSGTVDGLALWDTEIASLENTGFTFRKFLPGPKTYVSSSIVTRQDFIDQHPDVAKGFLRAIAKGTVYCLTNKEACVKMHWEVFPETRPRGGGTAAELAAAVHILDTRYALYDISRYKDVSRWGDAGDAQIDDAAEFMVKWGQLQKKLAPSAYFDRRFLDYANDFNPAEIKESAAQR
jgi:NitT/TauT family transport system substrate-binding protein